jgi:hypothetical protein
MKKILPQVVPLIADAHLEEYDHADHKTQWFPGHYAWVENNLLN